jgi:DNA-binding CsgD family transcriptional regulator
MLNVTNSVPDPVGVLPYRQRIDHLREEYQRTYKLLQQEGQRLNGFLGRAPLAVARHQFSDAREAGDTQAVLKDLTAREKDTLRCIAEGCSTKETAARLGIRFKTAACHRYRIMQKLGVHETTSLVRIAIRCGIVSV